MAAAFPDVFQTPRLILRPITPADAMPIFAAYAQDPEVTRFLTWRPHTRIEETQAYIAHCLATPMARTYVITARHDAAILGAFNLATTPPGRVDCGYVLARQHWGHGLMPEALAHLARWSLGQPGIWRIGGVCDVANDASARVMEKAGLVREGILRRWSLHPNVSDEPRDGISFAKVR